MVLLSAADGSRSGRVGGIGHLHESLHRLSFDMSQGTWRDGSGVGAVSTCGGLLARLAVSLWCC